MSGTSSYQPQNAFLKWFERRLPVLGKPARRSAPLSEVGRPRGNAARGPLRAEGIRRRILTRSGLEGRDGGGSGADDPVKRNRDQVPAANASNQTFFGYFWHRVGL